MESPQLYSRGTWTFEERLNEITVVRSDNSSLLQLRPRIPKQLPPLRDGKENGHHKGSFNYKGGGKRNTKGSTFDKKQNWCTWGFHNNQRVTLCMKFNAGECKRGSDCHYHHGCSIRLGNGRPCMQNHAAKDHKGST